MPTLTEVNHDPFAETPVKSPVVSPKLVPVDNDPFAPAPLPPSSYLTEEPKSTVQKVAQTANDFVRAAGNAATFGLADKFATLFPPSLGGGSTQQEADYTKDARSRSPNASWTGDIAGAILPGTGISRGVASAVPMLARPSIASIAANAGTTGGIMSGVDDVAHGTTPDPLKAATQGVASGVAGGTIGAASRALLPGVSFRATGSRLTPADKANMTDLGDAGRDLGLPLSIRETADAVAPGRSGSVAGTYNAAVNSPGGAQSNYDFNLGRQPRIGAMQTALDNAPTPLPSHMADFPRVLDAVRPESRAPFIDLPDHGDAAVGPVTKMFHMATDSQKASIARMMQDTDNIPLLNTRHGPTQDTVSAALAALHEINKNNYGKFMPLDLSYPGRNP